MISTEIHKLNNLIRLIDLLNLISIWSELVLLLLLPTLNDFFTLRGIGEGSSFKVGDGGSPLLNLFFC